jgi:2-polyprenyl-3-methyl-5-hydroxy-6-metoxy-1,4-benzoquinol methylase
MDERLRASPNFALALTMDGRPYVAKEVEPYTQYWMSDRERTLFGLCARRGGISEDDAVAACLRLDLPADPARERARLFKAIAGMRAVGVLLGAGDDTSRYDARMAAAYLTDRPFPRGIADHLIATAPVARDSQVLDLAGGPGSLALELARASDNVAMMELSKGFVSASRRAAKARNVKLNAIHDSCNRLVHHDGAYDVITISQALHWLDDVLVVRGVCRLLNEEGSFFVVHGALSLGVDHPLSYILGDKTPLGDKQRAAFVDEITPLLNRLTLLFDALDARGVASHNPSHSSRSTGRIVPVATTLFRQQRPIGEGFARAFLSPDHIAVTGQSQKDFWADLSARCAAATEAQCIGTQEWALLQFKRGGERMERVDPKMVEIGFDPGQG